MPIHHIVLIRSPITFPVDAFHGHEGVPPLGLAYLAGSLKAEGHQVTCIDGLGEQPNHFTKLPELNLMINGLTADEVVQRIPGDAAAIAFSTMFTNEWLYSSHTLSLLRARFPELPIIVGGEHITADFHQSMADCPAIDVAVMGEGEETLVDLLQTLGEGKPLDGVRGIVFRGPDGGLTQTETRARITKLDAIPWPDWGVIPLEHYLDRGLGDDTMGKRSIPMLASRGCPYRCTFCSSPQMWTTKWLARDPHDVLREIRSYIETYSIEHFEFYDLTAIVKTSWIRDFCIALIEADLNLTWSLPSGTRSEALTPEVLGLLKQSGCSKMTLAPESGSPTTLKAIKKMVKPASMLRVMRDCHKAGIVVKANMIIGFPDQTHREVLESYWFIVRMAWAGVDDVACFHFTPYPGSELYLRLRQEGKIQPGLPYQKYISTNVINRVSNKVSWSPHLRSWEMPFLVLGAMAIFYSCSFLLRPYRVALLAYRLAFSRPVTMLEMTLKGIYHDFFRGRLLKGLTRTESLEIPVSHLTMPTSGAWPPASPDQPSNQEQPRSY